MQYSNSWILTQDVLAAKPFISWYIPHLHVGTRTIGTFKLTPVTDWMYSDFATDVRSELSCCVSYLVLETS